MFQSKFLRATAELALMTYVVTVLGLVTAEGFDILSLSAWKVAATAAFSPVLAILYGVISRLLGDYNSPLVVDTRDKGN